MIEGKQSITDDQFRCGLEKLTQDVDALLDTLKSDDAIRNWSIKRKHKKAIELQRLLVPLVTILTLGNRREFLIKWRMSNLRWFASENRYGVMITFGEKALSRLSAVMKLTPQLNAVLKFWIEHGRAWMETQPEVDSASSADDEKNSIHRCCLLFKACTSELACPENNSTDCCRSLTLQAFGFRAKVTLWSRGSSQSCISGGGSSSPTTTRCDWVPVPCAINLHPVSFLYCHIVV